MLCPYGPDGQTSFSEGGLDLLYHAFHTTRESRLETQPHMTTSGAMLIWDGRLDNRVELIGSLGGSVSMGATDVSIVAAAYERSGTGCFAKLIGDWALSIWNPKHRSLVLAIDPVGTRHVYYAAEVGRFTWCTLLDPLILLAGKTFQLNDEYVAGWFSMFPAAHLTPYLGVQALRPASFLFVKDAKSSTQTYWNFDPDKRIRYRRDAEYEEHFCSVFTKAVRRRLRSDTPVLAELSGGMDSSSIVCVADNVIATEGAETPRLDTVSYFDDSEPNWNERPFFTKVEERRGRIGCHIDVGSRQLLRSDCEAGRFRATPVSASRPSETAREFLRCMTSQDHRVLVSGIGGDEVTGGVPAPAPELADLIARLQLRSLFHQLKAWSLSKRQPWIHLLGEALHGFCPSRLVGPLKHSRPVDWLYPAFARCHRDGLSGHERRLRLFGPLPSFQNNLNTLEGLRRQLACFVPPAEPAYEKRYPYLDRDLLEFIYAIPRQQVVRPGQRRSLMRRALAGTVPDELLNRKRKAFVTRRPRTAISAEWAQLVVLTENMVAASIGIIDSALYRRALEEARNGAEVAIVPLLRAIGVEMWLRNLVQWKVLTAR
ncbi:MAG TPA: asparagine synthase-related protein [Candidatus Acidoferrales bacterium]|nr:asparagine synthase-related protein [Candidatus Acidoferrales bacterium]